MLDEWEVHLYTIFPSLPPQSWNIKQATQNEVLANFV